MGEMDVAEMHAREMRDFTRRVLNDLQALEAMLKADLFETGIRRIGAEQEMFLVDQGQQPVPKAMEMLADLKNPAFTTELAQFNLEANLPPLVFGDGCLRQMEHDLDDLLGQARRAAIKNDAEVVLTGILPTLKISDLGLDNMAPMPRYLALNNALLHLAGGQFRVRIKGVNELDVTHDNVMLEACNTSFQLHFQTAPSEFVQLYNAAQAITAPVLACAVNSPILLEKRLWQETRIALFQHSVDDRSGAQRLRGRQARVRFGDDWLKNSVTEIFREDIARFRALVGGEKDENPMTVLARGEIPKLSALRLHNGTVYRWNRPCYGIHNGVPHLRIENRVLPAGPTVLDEVANAAFFFGLMAAVTDEYGDITKVMAFDEAKGNFIAAARLGLKAQFTWMDGRTATAADLVLDHLLPLAQAGLKSRGIHSDDIDRYLGCLDERVRSRQTGAQWMVQSLAKIKTHESTVHGRLRCLVQNIRDRQWDGTPVHKWTLAEMNDTEDWRHSYRTVGQFMTRDLFTVQPDDLVDLVANLMDWEQVRDIPVEHPDGRFAGLVDHFHLLRVLAQGPTAKETLSVRDVMKTDPVTVTASTPTVEALALMRDSKLGCLPVLQGDLLIGLVTEKDLFTVANRLLDAQLRGLG